MAPSFARINVRGKRCVNEFLAAQISIFNTKSIILLNLSCTFHSFFKIQAVHSENSFPPKLYIILPGGAEAPPAPMVETPMLLEVNSNFESHLTEFL